MKRLDGKVSVITGGASGLGRADSRCPASHYSKGIERRNIFKDDTDRKEWLKKYSSVSSAIERMKVRQNG